MQPQLKEQKTIPLTRDDFILMQLREIREDMRDVRGEIKDLRSEIKDVRDEIKDLRGEIKDVRDEIKDVRKELNGRMDKLEDTLNGRMDKLENEVRSTARHSQIMAGSVIAIALGVLYFVFTH